MPTAPTTADEPTKPSTQLDEPSPAERQLVVQAAPCASQISKSAPAEAKSDVRRYTASWMVLATLALAASWFCGGARVPTRFLHGLVADQPEIAPEEETPRFPQLLIDINSAGEAELNTLPGVGPSLAQAIIRYRSDTAAIVDPAQLRQIPGIGPKRAAELERLIAWPSRDDVRLTSAEDQNTLKQLEPPPDPLTPDLLNREVEHP